MNKLIILGHENPDVDSIVSGVLLEKILLKKGYDAEFIIPDKFIEDEVLLICLKHDLDPAKYMKTIDFNDKDNKYILVDHNERKLSGEIVCIIDHHPTSKEINIEHYYNNKISSTAALIGMANEEYLNEYDLKLAVLATLIDTASFHSTKSRLEDEIWVKYICDKYSLNYNRLYKEGLCLTKLENLEKASVHGLKKYNLDDKILEASYIQIEYPNNNQEKIIKIIELIKKKVISENLDAFVFIVFDMSLFKTDYYVITKNDLIKKHLDTYASRGTDIMPNIQKELKELQ